MKTHQRTFLTTAMAGAMILTPAFAQAQLANCAAILTSPPIAGNPAVFSATSTQQTTGGRDYCMVNVTWRDPSEVGSAAGYAPGGPPTVDTFQTIRMGIALPLQPVLTAKSAICATEPGNNAKSRPSFLGAPVSSLPVPSDRLRPR